MPTHKYLEKPNKQYLINNLETLLKYYNIHYSQSEIYSYNKKELKYLNYKYKIYFKGVTNKHNKWYKTCLFN